MGDILFSIYIAGSIPLLLILMYVIGKATPSEIIKDTVDFYPTERKVSQALQIPNLLLVIIFSVFGIGLACLYGYYKPENLSGFSLISFSVTLFAFLLTSQQIQEQRQFTNDLLGQIELNINYSIRDCENIEKLLYSSRILLFLGIALIMLGVVALNIDNLVWNLWSLQLKYLVMIAIGWGFANFGWGLERAAINRIIQPQILVKVKSLK